LLAWLSQQIAEQLGIWPQTVAKRRERSVAKPGSGDAGFWAELGSVREQF
jgi:hypothetical protein